MARTPSLARRIITLALALYLATAAAATLAEVTILATTLRSSADRQAAALTEAFGPSVALALWDFDEGQFDALLSSLAVNPAVGRVRIIQEGGPTLERSAGGPWGAPHSYPLVHRQEGRTSQLGSLVIEASLKQVERELASAVLMGAGRTVVLVLVLWLVLVFVVRRRAAAPLGRLAAEVSAAGPDQAERPLVSASGAGAELEQVAASFTRLLGDYRLTIARMASQRAQLRTLLDTLPDLVWLKDAEGRYLACNRRFEGLYGATEAQILGKTDFDFVDEATARLFREHDRLALEAGGPHRNEEEVTFASDGHQEYLDTIKTPVLTPDGLVLGVLGIGRDITDRRQAALQLEKLVQELRQSHKLESLGHLAGGLAHEMNNVLAAILGLTTVQLASAAPGSRLHTDLETIRRAAERGGGLVKNLLSFARRSPADVQRLQLNDLLSREQALVARVTASKARLVLDLDPALPEVTGDPDALLSAVLNLCGNAADAMPDGGTLTLRTQNRDGGAGLEVADTGTGMTAEVLAQALDPFFTTKPVGRGTGLGLSFVDSTVRGHGGRLELSSQPGQGTSVRLWLPAAGPSATEASGLAAGVPTETQGASPPGLRTEAGASLRVLVVDDDELVRESTGEILLSLGHRVEEAASGEEALGLLAEGPPPDLVVLDKNMPGLGGRGTLQALRRLLPEVPVLLATGLLDDEAQELIRTHGRVWLIGKPFTVSELAQKIGEVS